MEETMNRTIACPGSAPVKTWNRLNVNEAAVRLGRSTGTADLRHGDAMTAESARGPWTHRRLRTRRELTAANTVRA